MLNEGFVMAFASMFLVAGAFVVIILAVLFFIGLGMLIAGLVNSKRAKKVWPIVLDVLGSLCMLPFIILIIIGIVAYNKTNYDKMGILDEYDSLPEVWINESIVVESVAADQAMKSNVDAARKGDRDEFVECFSQETRDREGFEQYADDFLDVFPEGVTFKELKRSRTTSIGNVKYTGIRTGTAVYQGKFNGEWYFFTVQFAYYGSGHDEAKGVTYLAMMNLPGEANVIRGDAKPMMSDDSLYLFTYMPSSDEINARMVNNYAYLWNESDGPVVTKDEMREILTSYDTLQDAIDAGAIGHPNCVETTCFYYYELKPDHGEPRYAFVRTIGDYGHVSEAYVYTETTTDYEDPIVKYEKPDEN